MTNITEDINSENTEQPSNVGRRKFMKMAGVAGGGLVIGISLPVSAGNNVEQIAKLGVDKTFNPNAFIHLSENGDTLIYCGRCEMGQGISTALPSAVADEMEADWSRVRIEQADGDEEKYGPQATGGSASIRRMYQPMREAGAAAKAMLIAAAAKVWQTSVDNCYAKSHFVYNKLNQQKLAYGDLATIAANMPVPEKPRLKTKDEFRYIGHQLPRHDQDEVVVGKRIYGVDTKIPGMKYAAITHCPVLGGKLKTLDKSEALNVKGVLGVVEIPRFDVPLDRKSVV